MEVFLREGGYVVIILLIIIGIGGTALYLKGRIPKWLRERKLKSKESVKA